MSSETIELHTGDIVIDPCTSEVGFLVKRYQLFVDYDTITHVTDYVWAWDIYWTGSIIKELVTRHQTYTEIGIRLMIEAGSLKLKKN